MGWTWRRSRVDAAHGGLVSGCVTLNLYIFFPLQTSHFLSCRAEVSCGFGYLDGDHCFMKNERTLLASLWTNLQVLLNIFPSVLLLIFLGSL